MRPDALATSVVLTIKSALEPLTLRLNEIDARLVQLKGETALALAQELGAIREKVAVLEAREPLPGPPGKDGEPGPPGKDGTAGLTYQGVFQDGKSYDPGDVVTWGGSAWHANEPTVSKPGESAKAWTLVVKRGRDGKDGKP